MKKPTKTDKRSLQELMVRAKVHAKWFPEAELIDKRTLKEQEKAKQTCLKILKRMLK